VKYYWILVGGTSLGNALPWSDEAPAISVVLWLKAQMNGRVNVIVGVTSLLKDMGPPLFRISRYW
jgi:hypothetical protein